MQQQIPIDLNNATYVGIDCHPTEHTAVAVNRFEEEKGTLTFESSWDGMQRFLSWLQTIEQVTKKVVSEANLRLFAAALISQTLGMATSRREVRQ
jgi:hypothetical protein